jgi:hypothetical protein
VVPGVVTVLSATVLGGAVMARGTVMRAVVGKRLDHLLSGAVPTGFGQECRAADPSSGEGTPVTNPARPSQRRGLRGEQGFDYLKYYRPAVMNHKMCYQDIF